MKARFIVLLSGVLCLISPYIAKAPLGFAYVKDYCPNEFGFNIGIAFFCMISCLSISPWAMYENGKRIFGLLPLTLASVGLVGTFYYAHFSNPISSDAQAGIAFLMIPIFAAVIATFLGGFGLFISILTNGFKRSNR
jgi:hypothetical protein